MRTTSVLVRWGKPTGGTLEVVGVGKASVMSTLIVLSRLPFLVEAVRCSG